MALGMANQYLNKQQGHGGHGHGSHGHGSQGHNVMGQVAGMVGGKKGMALGMVNQFMGGNNQHKGHGSGGGGGMQSAMMGAMAKQLSKKF